MIFYIIVFIWGFAAGAIALELLWYDRRRKVHNLGDRKRSEEPVIVAQSLPEFGEPGGILGQDKEGRTYTLDDNGHWAPREGK